MKILALLDQSTQGRRGRLLLSAGLGGLLPAVAVQLINIAAYHESLDGAASALVVAILILIPTTYVVNRHTSRMIVHAFEDTLCELQRTFVHVLADASPRRVEGLARARGDVIADLSLLSSTAPAWAFTLTNIAFIGLCGVVIGLLSFRGFVVWAVCYVLIFALLWPAFGEERAQFTAASKVASGVRESLELLVRGFKQVKLNEAQGDSLLADIDARSSALYKQYTATAVHKRAAYQKGMVIFFLYGIGFSTFAGTSALQLSPQETYELVTIFTLCLGPTLFMLDGTHTLLEADEAAGRVLAAAEELRASAASAPEPAPGLPPPTLEESIRLDAVSFSYDDDGAFEVGPIDLSIRRGELIFVTGGNGSGKSTLMKLLLGLYQPRAGAILWDGVPVTPANRTRYRDLYSAVFNDSYLFDRLYGLDDARLDEYLQELGIAEIIQRQEGRFINLELSTGQRMRLAMVVALLEDRPVLMLDEWTANQDPETTRWYYHELVPRLQAQGKTIILVSHDERFFDLADRRIRMDAGRIVAED